MQENIFYLFFLAILKSWVYTLIMDQEIKLSEDEIKKQCADDLASMKSCGDVLWAERLQCGHIKTEFGSWMNLCSPGTSDYVAVVKNKSCCLSLIFIECKNNFGGKMSEAQVDFHNRVMVHPDIHYILLSDTTTLKRKILDIAFDRLAAILGPGEAEPDF